jgi:hypothetical protein
MSAARESEEGGGGSRDALMLCGGMNLCRSCAHQGKNCCLYKYMEGEEGEEEYCINVCALTNEGWISLPVEPVEKTVQIWE